MQTFFGQLLYIVIIPILQSKELNTMKPKTICLMIIWQVHTELPNTHGILPIPFYSKTRGLDPADIKSIQYIIGYIED
jgi:hypothetical protein